jgi:Piwi domain
MGPRGQDFGCDSKVASPLFHSELLRPDGRSTGNKDPFKHNFGTALSAYGLLNCQSFRLHGDELWDIIKLNPHRNGNKRSKEQQDFEAIKGNLQRLKSANVDLVVVLLPDENADTYATLKCVGDVVVGIRTLCAISGKHNSRTGDDIYANLAMKFNLKASQDSVNHMLDPEHKGPILDDTTCILGMDVVAAPRQIYTLTCGRRRIRALGVSGGAPVLRPL